MAIALDDLVRIYSHVLGPLMDVLAEAAGEDQVTGDDILDFFALGAATVLDNDSHIDASNTDIAVQTAAKRIERHVNGLRALRDATGKSLLATVLETGPFEDPLPN